MEKTFRKPISINTGNEIFGKREEKGKERSKLLRGHKNPKQTKKKNCALLKSPEVNDPY